LNSKKIKGDKNMKRIIILLITVSAVVHILTACDRTSAQKNTEPPTNIASKSAKENRGATPYIEIKNEPPPKLFVDPPLPDLLDKGVVWIQWRAENVHIAPVFGKGALQASPRLGHLHIQVDDLPWWWADPSNVNTIDMAGLPPGPHRIKITLVDANHEPFPGQSRTVTFTIATGGNANSNAKDKKYVTCG
jgi:uncharacterized protein DUF6130